MGWNAEISLTLIFVLYDLVDLPLCEASLWGSRGVEGVG